MIMMIVVMMMMMMMLYNEYAVETNEYDLQAVMYPIICTHHQQNMMVQLLKQTAENMTTMGNVDREVNATCISCKGPILICFSLGVITILYINPVPDFIIL